MTDRYRVVRTNTVYFIYDNEAKQYIKSYFILEKDAVAFCDELNRKEIHNVFQKIITTETERLKDWEWDDELREWKPKSSC